MNRSIRNDMPMTNKVSFELKRFVKEEKYNIMLSCVLHPVMKVAVHIIRETKSCISSAAIATLVARLKH